MDKPKNAELSLEDGEYLIQREDSAFRLKLSRDGVASLGDGEEAKFEILDGSPESGEFTLLYGNTVYRITGDGFNDDSDPSVLRFRINGQEWTGDVDDRRSLLARRFGQGAAGSSGEVTIKAPMPGLVSKILVRAGEEVEKGQGLLILEAMKMENELKADHSGKVVRIDCEEGRPVEKQARLIVIHYEH